MEHTLRNQQETEDTPPEEAVLSLTLLPGDVQSTNFGVVHNYFDTPITITVQRHENPKRRIS